MAVTKRKLLMVRSSLFFSLRFLSAVVHILTLSLGAHDNTIYPLNELIERAELSEPLVFKPVLVIGSGPAGLSAAHAVRQAGISVELVTGPHQLGQLIESSRVDNIPGFAHQTGREIMERMYRDVCKAGVSMIHSTVTKLDLSKWPFRVELDNQEIIYTGAVILATGSRPRLLGVPGEALFFGKGVSTCAWCDNIFFEGSSVVIIGGGDSAIEQARLLLPYAKDITILIRSGVWRAKPDGVVQLKKHDSITVLFNKQVEEIEGTENQITHVKTRDTQTGEISSLKTQGVFLAIGRDPEVALVHDLLKLTSEGYIWVDATGTQTSVPGVFAVGEVCDNIYRQVLVAQGSGYKGGMHAAYFIHDMQERIENWLGSRTVTGLTSDSFAENSVTVDDTRDYSCTRYETDDMLFESDVLIDN